MVTLSHVVLVFNCVVAVVHGHGRLINPPGRSTMWKYGFNTPQNSNDHQLSCGGFGVQFYQNNGRCGICGDRYDGPRDNEAGGKYATGTIARRYQQGQVITVEVEITVNHGGWFEFKICPNNDPKKAATQDCLDRYLLRQTNGETRYQVVEGLGIATVQLQLPRDVTCTQCVLQWRWNTASNTACDGSECCRGCGPQEQFYGCADIAISSAHTSNNNYNQPAITLRPLFANMETTRRPYAMASNNAPNGFVPIVSGNNQVTSGSQYVHFGSHTGNQYPSTGSLLPSGPIGAHIADDKCVATQKYASSQWDEWCERTCANGNQCPKDICTDACRKPEVGCMAKAFFRDKQVSPSDADSWCQERCASGFCPLEYCQDICVTLSDAAGDDE